MPRKNRPPPPPPLPDNGTVQVVYGKNNAVLDYKLESIHYRLNEDTSVAVCTLNEPSRLNALTTNQMWEYFLVLKHAARDERVKCLVWTGHGRAFSSGADLSGGGQPTLIQEARDWFVSTGEFSPGASNIKNPDFALKCLVLAFWDFPKPSVIAVNGLAVGGAANIALSNCHDVVIISTNARFKYPFANLNFTPELGSSYLMPFHVGYTRAKRMMMLGEWISAEQANQMGLVTEVTSPEDLLPRAMAVAEKVASKNPRTIRLIKEVMNTHMRKRIAEVLDIENVFFNDATGFRKRSKL